MHVKGVGADLIGPLPEQHALWEEGRLTEGAVSYASPSGFNV